MILIPKKRAWVTVTVMLLVVSCCAGGGYLLGRANIQKSAEEHLVQMAQLGDEPLARLLNESAALLPILNKSTEPSCSDAEVAFFRKQIFHAETLRDAGRMRNGKIECSALLGRDAWSHTAVQPIMTVQGGMKFYLDVPPYLPISNHAVFLLQMGDTYVVEDLHWKDHWPRPHFAYQTTLLDEVTHERLRPSGRPLLHPGSIIDRDWQGQSGDLLYITRCKPGGAFCTTTYASSSQLLKDQWGLLFLDSSLGGLLGGILVLLYIQIRLRSQNLSQQLRRAIGQDKLHLVYQPIVDLQSGRIVEAEALARWTDEDGFVVSPDIFVKIAEEHGFVADLTKLVVRRALRDFKELLQSHQKFRLNVNVTAADLGDGKFLPMMDQALLEAGILAANLAIEVTESSTARKKEAVDTIHRLRQRGHSVQIDDFGTGYSSLAYLQDLSVDTIKIDKAFTQSIGTQAVTSSILPQILAMAEALDLQVIAEGIETAEQAAFFASRVRPILGQGWFFGRPIPIAEFHTLLSENENRPELKTETQS